MKIKKLRDRASMQGIGHADTDRIIMAQRHRGLPVAAWFKNYEGATPQQKDSILSILRESTQEA